MKKSLTALYKEYNQKYFGGRLPRYLVTFYSFSLAGKTGECINKRRLIRIQRGLSPEEFHQTLLHEMCHITGGEWHGKRFRNALLRLAKQEEAWAEKEAKELAKSSWIQNVVLSICDHIDELARTSPRPTFSNVLRGLSPYYCSSTKEFLRKFPWVKARWKKICLEVDKERKARSYIEPHKAKAKR